MTAARTRPGDTIPLSAAERQDLRRAATQWQRDFGRDGDPDLTLRSLDQLERTERALTDLRHHAGKALEAVDRGDRNLAVDHLATGLLLAGAVGARPREERPEPAPLYAYATDAPGEFVGRYASREDAARAAWLDRREDVRGRQAGAPFRVTTGRLFDPAWQPWCRIPGDTLTDWLCAAAAEASPDAVADQAVAWIDASAAQMQVLEQRVGDAIRDWVQTFGLQPDWRVVGQLETTTITPPDPDTDPEEL